MKPTMKIISSREVYKCGLFRVTEEEATDPSGFHINRSIVRHMGSAVMMPVDEKKRILLVRQFRPLKRENRSGICLEAVLAWMPAKSRYRPPAANCGKRPATRPASGLKLARFWPSPGFVDEVMTIYLATGLAEGKPHPMDDERIECRWFTRRELDGMIRAGKIEDGKTIIGFLTWLRMRETTA